MAIAKLFKVNKLGPIGLVASIVCFVGIFLPWKSVNIVTTGRTINVLANGTLEPIGCIMAILIVLYVLLLFANFKWNILVGVAILIMSIYEWWLIRAEAAASPLTFSGYGLYVIMISAAVMSLSKILLFRKKKTDLDKPPIQP